MNIRAVSPFDNMASSRSGMSNTAMGFRPNNAYINGNSNVNI